MAQPRLLPRYNEGAALDTFFPVPRGTKARWGRAAAISTASPAFHVPAALSPPTVPAPPPWEHIPMKVPAPTSLSGAQLLGNPHHA